MKFLYHIEGMHCASCIEKIRTALAPHFKILDVKLNPPTLHIEAEHAPPLSALNAQIATAGKYSLHPIIENSTTSIQIKTDEKKGLMVYYPIFLIAAYIFGVATINNTSEQGIHWLGWMHQFMAGFFLVFSAFKLLDIRGFAEGYATYDLLAKHWCAYGYIYPFLELSLGVLYLTNWLPTFTPLMTIVLMGFSSLGVINSLLKKQKFQCACLGTMLKVPLSSITLIEDLVMVVMAALTFIM